MGLENIPVWLAVLSVIGMLLVLTLISRGFQRAIFVRIEKNIVRARLKMIEELVTKAGNDLPAIRTALETSVAVRAIPPMYSRFKKYVHDAQPTKRGEKPYSWLWEELKDFENRLDKLGAFRSPPLKLLDEIQVTENAAQYYADLLEKIERLEEEARRPAIQPIV